MTQAEEASFPDWKLDSTMASQGIKNRQLSVGRRHIDLIHLSASSYYFGLKYTTYYFP